MTYPIIMIPVSVIPKNSASSCHRMTVFSIIASGTDTVTMAVRTYLAIGEGYVEITSAMSVILVVPSLVILAMIQSGIQPEKLVGGFKGV